MGFLKKLMCWRKQESKKSRLEEVYGETSIVEGDFPVECDAELEMNPAVDLDAKLQRDVPMEPEAEFEMNPAVDLDAKLQRDVPMEPEAPLKGDAASGGPDDVSEEPYAGASEEPDAEASEEPDAGASEEPDPEASEEPDAGASEEPDAEASDEPDAGASEPDAVASKETDPDVMEERDSLQDEAKSKISSLEEEVERLKKMLREKDVIIQLEQLFLERRMCSESTEEDQLLDLEENLSRFSLWGKVKYVAGGVFVGLVTLLFAITEVEITFVENQDSHFSPEWNILEHINSTLLTMLGLR
jgi:hypothetical protein